MTKEIIFGNSISVYGLNVEHWLNISVKKLFMLKSTGFMRSSTEIFANEKNEVFVLITSKHETLLVQGKAYAIKSGQKIFFLFVHFW